MSDVIKEHLLKPTQYFGKYRGRVVDNQDPKKLGRICVFVPRVHGFNIEDGGSATSGWAWPVHFRHDAVIPSKGSTVWVEFEEGNVEFPLWQLGPFTQISPTETNAPDNFRGEYGDVDNKGRNSEDFSQSHFSSEYAKTRTIKHGNNLIQIEEGDNDRILIQHQTGTRIEILNDGTIHLYARGNVVQVVDGQVHEKVKGASEYTSYDNKTEIDHGNVIKTHNQNYAEFVLGNTAYVFKDVTESNRNKVIQCEGSYQVVAGGDVANTSLGEMTMLAVETMRLLSTGATLPSPSASILPVPPLVSMDLVSANPLSGVRIGSPLTSELYVGMSQLLMSCLTQIVLQAPVVNVTAPITNISGILNVGIPNSPVAKAIPLMTWLAAHTHGTLPVDPPHLLTMGAIPSPTLLVT